MIGRGNGGLIRMESDGKEDGVWDQIRGVKWADGMGLVEWIEWTMGDGQIV